MKTLLVALCVAAVALHFSLAQEKSASTRNTPHLSPQDQKSLDMETVLWEPHSGST